MPSLVTNELLDAIAQAESNNAPGAVGDTQLRHRAYGAYQMRLPAYQDVQRLYPKEFRQIPFERLRSDTALQRLAAKRYLQALESAYGIKELDRLIAGYNAGPNVRTGKIRNMEYVKKVKRLLQREGGAKMRPRSMMPDEGDSIERGLRRINRLAEKFGVSALSIKEIASALEQHTPRTPIRGIQARAYQDEIVNPRAIPYTGNEAHFEHPMLRGSVPPTPETMMQNFFQHPMGRARAIQRRPEQGAL